MNTLTQEKPNVTLDTESVTLVETALIASDKIEGTNIFDTTGEKIGSVRKLMINPITARVDYVVMGFGGLFGMGEDLYPVPFETLSYDPRVEGFRLKHIAKSDLDSSKAPSIAANDEFVWSDELARSARLFYLKSAA